MYEAHWGLRESPFRAAADPKYFHQSPTHDEALARLHFLVENGRHLGLLLGSSGSGKTLLLRVLAQQLRRQAVDVAIVSLLSAEPREVLYELASQLGTRPHRTHDTFTLGRQIADRLTENRYQQLSTVLLLDDADETSSEVLGYVLRLLNGTSSPESRVTVVLSLEGDNTRCLGLELLERAELRIEIEDWTESDTAEYLEMSMLRAGSARGAFDPSAAGRVHQLARGVPRHINQIAELALLAGAGRNLAQIDRPTVDSVYEELCVYGAAALTQHG